MSKCPAHILEALELVEEIQKSDELKAAVLGEDRL